MIELKQLMAYNKNIGDFKICRSYDALAEEINLVFESHKGFNQLGLNLLIRPLVWVKPFICDSHIIVYLMNYPTEGRTA